MYHMMSSFPSIKNKYVCALKLVKIYTGLLMFTTICKKILLAFIWYQFHSSSGIGLRDIAFISVLIPQILKPLVQFFK